MGEYSAPSMNALSAAALRACRANVPQGFNSVNAGGAAAHAPRSSDPFAATPWRRPACGETAGPSDRGRSASDSHRASSLPSSTGPSSPTSPDRAPDQAQRDFRRHIRANPWHQMRSSMPPRHASRAGRTPPRPTASMAASLRRTRRASWTSRSAVSPSAASAGASLRQRTRAKRGSSLLGSSAWRNPGRTQGRDEPRLRRCRAEGAPALGCPSRRA